MTAIEHPCFCLGPWRGVDPADRPDSALAREHESGSEGCEYVEASLTSEEAER